MFLSNQNQGQNELKMFFILVETWLLCRFSHQSVDIRNFFTWLNFPDGIAIIDFSTSLTPIWNIIVNDVLQIFSVVCLFIEDPYNSYSFVHCFDDEEDVALYWGIRNILGYHPPRDRIALHDSRVGEKYRGCISFKNGWPSVLKAPWSVLVV